MAYGAIEYDLEGNPKCEICGKFFKRVLNHVRQKHHIKAIDYKVAFGLDTIKGICSEESSLISREKTLANYDKCIGKNLIANGAKTRFLKGTTGRVKEMVSDQTRTRLKERLKEPYMVEAMKQSGSKLGKSGKGNLKRWGLK